MSRPVAAWQLKLDAGGGGELPAFLRIARAIADGARSGRLAPGSRLPGSRELAGSLDVHRNTVLAAYRELASEGFLETAQGRGTFIARTLPEQKPRRWQASKTKLTRGTARTGSEGPPRKPSAAPGFDFVPPPRAALPIALPPRMLALYGGLPDTRLLPRPALARAYRRALRARGELLGYGDPQGEPRLRQALAQMLCATRGLRVEAEDILVTRGSQMALSLLGRVLVRPGDRVAVEAYGYAPAWRALAQREGVTLVPIAVDAQGLDVEALARVHAEAPIRAVYVTPHHQYPTTVTMSAARRMALLALARSARFAVIEDDYDHEFHYEGRPVLPLASADDAGNVAYIGTLSKSVAPGLRIGYLVAPAVVREAALAARFDLDRQGDRVSEHALAELMDDGELQRHLWRTRRTYRARRDFFVDALTRAFGARLDFHVPPGGMALWARVERTVDVEAWHARAFARGVTFQLGKQFRFDSHEARDARLVGGRATPHVRLGYAVLNERELAQAVQRLRETLDD